MQEEIDGFRRTSIKTRDRSKLNQKIDEFKERGEETMVKTVAGIHYLYIRKEKPLGFDIKRK